MPKVAKKKPAKKKPAKTPKKPKTTPKPKIASKAKNHYWYFVEKVFGRPPKSVKIGMQLGMPYKDKHGSYTIVNVDTGKLVWGFSGRYVGRTPVGSVP